jgi:ABC-2 type transport system permease protein
MWKDMWFLVWTTLRTTFRKRSNIFLYLCLPIAGVLASTLIYGSSHATLRIGVVNGDGAERIAADTVRFVEGLQNAKVVPVTREELRRQLAGGKLDSGLLIEAGYSQSVLAGNPDHISIQSVKGTQVTAYMKAMLNGYVDNVAAMGSLSAGDAGKITRLYDEYVNADVKLTSQTVNDASVTMDISYQSIGFLITFMMTSAVSLSGLILRNRENRTYFRILSSPVHARTYVISNIAVNLIVMMVQIVIAVFFLTVVFRQSMGVPAIEMIGLLSLFGLVSVSLSLAIVAFSNSSAAAGAIQNFVIHPTCIVAGCYFPISIMPDAVRKAASFLPQNWLLQSYDRLQEGEGPGSILFHISVLLAFAIVFFLVATYKFGRNNDTRSFV